MKKRDIYLEDLPLAEAWARITAALEAAGLWSPLPGETIPLAEALGRVTAEPVWAAVSSPHYHASAMDGYAVRARDTEGASETSPLTLSVVTPDAEVGAGLRPAPADTDIMRPAYLATQDTQRDLLN